MFGRHGNSKPQRNLKDLATLGKCNVCQGIYSFAAKQFCGDSESESKNKLKMATNILASELVELVFCIAQHHGNSVVLLKSPNWSNFRFYLKRERGCQQGGGVCQHATLHHGNLKQNI